MPLMWPTMHPAAVYITGQAKSFDDLPSEIKSRILELSITTENVTVRLDGPDSHYQGVRDRYPLFWSPSWIPQLRLVSKSFSAFATFFIARHTIPAVSVLPSEYTMKGAAEQTIKSIDLGSIFPALLTAQVKQANVRDNYASTLLRPHIEIDVHSTPNLQTLILGPIDIALLASHQVSMSQTLRGAARTAHFKSLAMRMMHDAANNDEVSAVIFTEIMPMFAAYGFSAEVVIRSVRRLMRMWAESAGKSAAGYAHVMQQVAGMVGLGRERVKGLPAEAEIVVEFYDSSRATRTGKLVYKPGRNRGAAAVYPIAAKYHNSSPLWRSVLG